MSNLLSVVQAALSEAKYETWLIRAHSQMVVCFEDVSIMGYVGIFPTAEALLKDWKAFESDMLNHFSASIRSSGEKAWNIYTVLLTEAPASDDEKRAIRWIEEELHRTRKLAGAEINSQFDLLEVLLPIIGMQQQASILMDDARDRLMKRIAAIAPSIEQIALKEDVSPSDVVSLLMSVKT